VPAVSCSSAGPRCSSARSTAHPGSHTRDACSRTLPASRQAVRPSRRQAVRPSGRQAVKPSGRQAVRSSSRQAVRPSGCHGVRPSIRQAVKPSRRQAVTRSRGGQAVKLSSRQDVKPSGRQAARERSQQTRTRSAWLVLRSTFTAISEARLRTMMRAPGMVNACGNAWLDVFGGGRGRWVRSRFTWWVSISEVGGAG